MGKRSNFERRPRDLYPTPLAAALPLLPHLMAETQFVEPCAGGGALVGHLEGHGHRCVAAFDIEPQQEGALFIFRDDATTIKYNGPGSCFITNSPWSRAILHPIIRNLASQMPTWLLLYSDWLFNAGSAELVDRCELVVPVGRVKWIEGSKYTGKENCAWMRFDMTHRGGPRLWPRVKLSREPKP